MNDPGIDTPIGLAPPTPGEDEATARRRLCLGAMAGAPGLLRYAARFAPSLEDAEDAYQRAMEIALTKGPMVDQREFIAWLHVVLRNEATSLARKRTREAPADAEVVTAAVERAHGGRDEPSAVVEWKERYRTLQDAMTSLNEAERICLLLRTAGVSRAEIRTMTGYTERKVERSIVRGRERLNEWHHSMAAGEKCLKMRAALERRGGHTRRTPAGVAPRASLRPLPGHAARAAREQRRAAGTGARGHHRHHGSCRHGRARRHGGHERG